MQAEEQIMISIVVPHYNSADLLTKLLSTIPNVSQIETIVVDDHSSEKLEELQICKEEYGNRNITFIENRSEKKGAGAARNIGMRYAKGKYLLFADADDWFVDGFWDVVQSSIANEADIIYFAPTSIKANGRMSKRHVFYANLIKEYMLSRSYQNELKLRYLYVSPCSKLIKRSVVAKNRILYDEVPFADDMMFAAKLGIAAKKIKVSNDVIYCILEHEGSLTKNRSDKVLMVQRNVYCRYYFYLKSNLSTSDFRMLGFGLKNDRQQIKSIMSVLQYERGLGKRWKEIFRGQKNMLKLAWRSFMLSDMAKELSYKKKRLF